MIPILHMKSRYEANIHTTLLRLLTHPQVCLEVLHIDLVTLYTH